MPDIPSITSAPHSRSALRAEGNRLTSAPTYDPEVAESEQLMRLFSMVLEREVAETFVRRLALLQLVLAAASFGTAVGLDYEAARFGSVWLMLMFAQVVLIRGLYLPRTLPYLERLALASIVLGGGWVLLVAFTGQAPQPVVSGLFLVLLFGGATLPWSARMNIFVGALLFVAACVMYLFGLLGKPHSFEAVLSLVLLAILPFGTVRLAAEQRLQLIARVTHRFLGEYCESTASVAMVTLRLLTWQALEITAARRGLIAAETAGAEAIENKKSLRSTVDPVFSRSLNQRLKDLSIDRGIVSSKIFGSQFHAPLHDWFGYVPPRLVVLRFLMVIDEREQYVTLAIPTSVGASLCGESRVIRSLRSLSALARISLAAARSRFLTSDSLLLSQRSLSERDAELNELVHLVNNVAQDIAMQCEDLHTAVGTFSAELKEPAVKDTLTLAVRELEVASRNLSTGVSDRKLLKELRRLRNFPRTEVAAVSPVVEDLGTFGSYRARRRAGTFTLVNEVPPNQAVRVVSRELLESSLRALVQESFSDVHLGSEVRVEAKVVDELVVIEVQGDAAATISSSLMAAEGERSERDPSKGVLEAVSNLARLSHGTFIAENFSDPNSPERQRSRFVLSLPQAALISKTESARGKWALFVDDNPQVTTFYGRIAEALQLPFVSAASVTEAKAAVKVQGMPRLVITDLQLGEESGLDLVRFARQEYGNELPIIVVSGNVAEEVRSDVRQAGATAFLAKPVGRARLFAEIESILGGKPVSS